MTAAVGPEAANAAFRQTIKHPRGPRPMDTLGPPNYVPCPGTICELSVYPKAGTLVGSFDKNGNFSLQSAPSTEVYAANITNPFYTIAWAPGPNFAQCSSTSPLFPTQKSSLSFSILGDKVNTTPTRTAFLLQATAGPPNILHSVCTFDFQLVMTVYVPLLPPTTTVLSTQTFFVKWEETTSPPKNPLCTQASDCF